MARRSIEAKIAEQELKTARLKEQLRKEKTREKVLVGSVVLTKAERSPEAAKQLVETLNETKWREHDRKIIDPLLEKLTPKNGG